MILANGWILRVCDLQCSKSYLEIECRFCSEVYPQHIQDLVEDLSNIIIVCCVLQAISGAACDHLLEILLQVFIVYTFLLNISGSG